MAGKLYTIRVTGTGRFPVDMLRYDCAYPVDGGGVHLIERTPEDTDYFDLKSAEFVCARRPTAGRWNSFGWQVEEVR